MVVHGRPKTPKNTSLLGVTQPPRVAQPQILGDTTRPGHVTCVLIWSKSDRRRLRKTLHKQTNRQTNRQTDRHYENNGHFAVNQYTHTISSFQFSQKVAKKPIFRKTLREKKGFRNFSVTVRVQSFERGVICSLWPSQFSPATKNIHAHALQPHFACTIFLWMLIDVAWEEYSSRAAMSWLWWSPWSCVILQPGHVQ